MVSVNVALDILLGFTIGPLGVALATSVAGIVGTVTVSVALFRWSGYDREKIIAILKIILASLVMSCVMIAGRTLFGTGFISTSLTLVAGIIVYFLSARILRVGNLFKLRDLLRNKKSSSQ
jgi:putative peptidoglycan lipid II flippase